ncbi:MAG: T9SS type A sorting domain-containing protein [Candidatus Limisoma sp.]
MKKFLLVSAAVVLGAGVVTAGVTKFQKQTRALPNNMVEVAKMETKKDLALTKVEMAKRNLNRAAATLVGETAKCKILRTTNGQIVKVAKNNKLGKTLNTKAPRNLIKASAAFSENFEGWDGETAGWLPEGWTAEHKSTEFTYEDAPSAQWQVSTDDYFYNYAIEGDYFASMSTPIVLQFDGEGNWTGYTEYAYDEWMVLPAVTIGEGDRLGFLLQYSAGWLLINEETYAFDKKNNNIEVLVSEDGQNWTSVWNVYDADVVKNYADATDDELFDNLMDWPWAGFTVDLSAYVGKTIQIAFRNAGYQGSGVAVDYVNIGEIPADASYEVPYNWLGWGYATDSSVTNWFPKRRMAEPFKSYKFENTSLFCDEAEWGYNFDDDDNPTESVFSRNLTQDYEIGFYDMPILTSTVGNSTATYRANGWEASVSTVYSPTLAGLYPFAYLSQEDYNNGTPTYFEATNFDMYEIEKVTYFTNLGNTEEGISILKSFLDDASEDVKFEGIASYIPAPEEAFALNGVYLNLVATTDEAAAATPIYVDVYKLVGGKLEKIGSGETNLASSVLLGDFEDGTGQYSVTCGFYEQIGAIQQQVALTIDGPTLVVLRFDGNLEFYTVNFMNQGINSLYNYYNTYALGFEPDGSFAVSQINGVGATFKDGIRYNIGSCGMTFDVSYPWLVADTKEYDYIDEAGGTATFSLDSFYDAAYLQYEGEGLDDWFTVSAGEYDSATGLQPVEFTLDALPDGVDERLAVCNVSAPGLKTQTFYIAQRRQSGVAAMKNNSNRVSVVNGNFVVRANKATAVEVYNVAGQKVANAQVKGGNAFIPAADLAKGIYMVKFNDNTVVKVMK